MTAEGLLEVAFVTWGVVGTMFTLLITIVSGYLVVAFVAGERMTTSQAVLVNVFYTFIMVFLVYATNEMAFRAAVIENAGLTSPLSLLVCSLVYRSPTGMKSGFKRYETRFCLSDFWMISFGSRSGGKTECRAIQARQIVRAD